MFLFRCSINSPIKHHVRVGEPIKTIKILNSSWAHFVKRRNWSFNCAICKADERFLLCAIVRPITTSVFQHPVFQLIQYQLTYALCNEYERVNRTIEDNFFGRRNFRALSCISFSEKRLPRFVKGVKMLFEKTKSESLKHYFLTSIMFV